MKQITKIFLTGLLIAICFLEVANAQTWVAKASITQSASGRGAAQSFVLNNKFYVAGGYVGFTSGYTPDMQMFDPVANTWTSKSSPTEPNRSSGVAFVINGKAYMGLGAKNLLSFSPPETLLTDLSEYNDATNSWTSKAAFPDSGRTSSAVFVLNNKAYVVGGEKGVAGLRTPEVWEYNPASNTWTKKNDFAGGGIAYTTAFTIGSKAYVTGGILADATVSNKTYEYNATSDTWVLKANLPISNQAGIAFTIGNDAYYGLGSDKNLGGTGAVFPTIFYKYNVSSDLWTATSYNWTAAGRLWSVAGVINNMAYVGAGYKFSAGEFAYKDLFELAFAPSGTLQIESKEAVLVYPNPAFDKLYLNTKLTNGSLAIYSTSGQLVFSKDVFQDNSIDISSFASGQYFITLKSEGKKLHQRISVVR